MTTPPPRSSGDRRLPVVSFLSDFGLQDIFVGVVHGILAQRAPHARIVDVTHDVPPHDVRVGALLLSRAVTYLSPAVHLAVVDPGVGTARAGIAVATAQGDVLVGPDNGLLAPAAAALGGAVGVHELANPAHRLSTVSATFHGRDVFAPAAAALARGVPVTDLGPAARMQDLSLPTAKVTAGRIEAEVVLVDRFGNVQLAARRDDLSAAQLGDPVAVDTGRRVHSLRLVRTFGDLDVGELGIHVDADGHVALIRNGGSAQDALQLAPGHTVSLGSA